MKPKYQYFDGVKFTRDEKTGYYLNSTIRKRLHRFVWEYYNGPIPKGYVVHHIDEDKSNNAIENLELMKLGSHSRLHLSEYARKNYKRMMSNLDEVARPAANEWHKSETGREWHKKQYERTKEKLHHTEPIKCQNCGKEFVGQPGKDRFCSNACKSAYRRKSGVDNVTRSCAFCGGPFIVNKYAKTKYCRDCAAKAVWSKAR